MIQADLVVRNIGELATPRGARPLRGTAQSRVQVLHDAVVAARRGSLVFVGSREEAAARIALSPGGRELDAEGGTVTPGFVDAHTHPVFAGWRESEFDERLRGASYSDIAARGGGILSTVAATRRAGLEALARSFRERLDAMLRLGTTTVEAKSGYGLSVEDELKLLRAVRAGAEGHLVQVVPTFLGAHTVPPEFQEDREGYLRAVNDAMLPAVASEGLARYADAFVDAHAFTLEEARRVLVRAAELGLGVRLHADQLRDEGAASLAAELGAASADHLEYASERGLEAMARAGVCGVLLPAATFFLRMNVRPPGRRLVDAGVPVVVATDFNPGSSPTEFVGCALWFACLEGGLTVDEALCGATLNAACSLGLGETTGSLEPGKRADLVVHAVPNRYHLVYRFGVPRIRGVVAGGEVARWESGPVP